MDNENVLRELMEKVKNGTATKEERLVLLKTMNASMDALKILIGAVKDEKNV